MLLGGGCVLLYAYCGNSRSGHHSLPAPFDVIDEFYCQRRAANHDTSHVVDSGTSAYSTGANLTVYKIQSTFTEPIVVC